MRDCGFGIRRGGAVARQLPRNQAALTGTRSLLILIILAAITSRAFCQQPSSQSSAPGAPTPPDQAQTPSPTTPPGQDQGTPPDQTKPQEQNPSIAAQAENAALEPVRIFNLLEKKSIVFPDIAATETALTPMQKFKLFVDNTISVHTILAAMAGSALTQADNAPTGFGQGWGAYGKRFSTSMARDASGEFFGTFILASALHEDPRFFPLYKPAFKSSLKYSVRCLFITRNDDGERVKNISGLAGPLMGEALANVYWPDRNRSVLDTLSRYGVDLLSHAAGNMVRQYWPVIFAKVQQKQQLGDHH